VLKRILIANRGEIVPRILRTAKKMGIETVVVYSDADASASYLAEADKAIHIGHSLPQKSYLNIEVLIDAIKESGADAVHPGYGFLSEQAEFARAVTEAGAKWIGPSPTVLEDIESKSYCRNLAKKSGVPTTPGSDGLVRSASEISKLAEEIGYPVLLKLDKGGGGKGIEMIEKPLPQAEIERLFEGMRRIGKMAFQCGDVYLEKRLLSPKHIEVQFAADEYGGIVCLGERECSIQRRYQKVMEESPSSAVSGSERAKLYTYTGNIAREIGYHGVGTVEYLKDTNGEYYFMEINARLQVEHPVSEMVTGIDIVEWQIRIAAGEALPLRQEDVSLTGHAIEIRIYAEDPKTHMPSPGLIKKLVLPKETRGVVRVEHAIGEGTKMSPYYDPLLCKIITHGADRLKCIKTAAAAAAQVVVEGISTNVSYCLSVLGDERFVSGRFTTDFDSEQSELKQSELK